MEESKKEYMNELYYNEVLKDFKELNIKIENLEILLCTVGVNESKKDIIFAKLQVMKQYSNILKYDLNTNVIEM